MIHNSPPMGTIFAIKKVFSIRKDLVILKDIIVDLFDLSGQVKGMYFIGLILSHEKNDVNQN